MRVYKRDGSRGDWMRSAWRVAAIAVAGVALQLLFGALNITLLHAPVNLLLGAAMVSGAVVCAIFRESRFVRRFSGVPFAVTLLAAILMLCLLMGLIPQSPAIRPEESLLSGLQRMTSSWPFALLYITLLCALAATLARRLAAFRLRDYAFYLNHVGIWLILFAAGFGAADFVRCSMWIATGASESTGQSRDGREISLPFSVRLNRFEMEEYPPKLYLAHPVTGNYLPEKRPVSFQIEPKIARGQLLDWHIRIESYLPDAVLDTTGVFKRVAMPGSAPAVEVCAIHRRTGEERYGWVFRGNAMQSGTALPLDETTWLVMGAAEARRYLSEVEIIQPGRLPRSAGIEVNHPLRIGAWRLYQYGYDTQAGRMSRYTVLEAVYDPWGWVVYVGIALLALGCFSLFSGKKIIKESLLPGLKIRGLSVEVSPPSCIFVVTATIDNMGKSR